MMRKTNAFRILMTVAMLCLGSTLACSGPGGSGDDPATNVPSQSDSTATSASASGPDETPIASSTGTTDGTGQVGQPGQPAVATATTATIDTSVPELPTRIVTPNPTEVYSTPAVPDPTATPNGNPEPAEGVLPNNRVIAFYGHPNDNRMGILGVYETKEETLAHLRQIEAEYEAADPTLPVIPAFELIATVAQPIPGDDGDYLADTDPAIIQEYVDFTQANDMLLILDVQLGHDSVPNQIEKIRKWLEYPHVHVALDPEFATKASPAVPIDRVPGEFIGELDGHEVNQAIEMISDLVATKGLPRKMLIVHQFESEMLYNKYVITPQPGVDFVLDMDGFGSVEAKASHYNIFVRDELIEYGGIKLFFQEDADPFMGPAEINALDPQPLVVIIQ